MKKVELIFGAILVPIDFLMLTLAGITAYFLRFRTIADIKPAIYSMPFNKFFAILLATAFVFLFIFAFSGLYNISGTRRITRELRRIFFACSTGVLVIIILVFFNRDLFSSRFIILAAWGCGVIYVSFARVLIIEIERLLFSRGFGVHRVVLVGGDKTSSRLEDVLNNKKLGYEIIEKTSNFDESTKSKLLKIVGLKNIDEILLADAGMSREKRMDILDFCNEHHLVFKYASDTFDSQTSRVEIRPVGGIPVIEIKRTPLDGWGKIFKRIFDIVSAIFLIILTGPLMLVAALLIKLTSRGPVIYRNERVGEAGKLFDTLKFRTMKAEFCIGKQFKKSDEALKYEGKLIEEKSIKAGPVYKIKNDPRLTPIGKFLRDSSIDELPQFFNVLMGEMSLVGPRPHQQREVEKYAKHHRKVLGIKPGITGMAQISGRSDLDFEEEIRLDTYYVENWSFWLDLYIACKTPFSILSKRGAL